MAPMISSIVLGNVRWDRRSHIVDELSLGFLKVLVDRGLVLDQQVDLGFQKYCDDVGISNMHDDRLRNKQVVLGVLRYRDDFGIRKIHDDWVGINGINLLDIDMAQPAPLNYRGS